MAKIHQGGKHGVPVVFSRWDLLEGKRDPKAGKCKEQGLLLLLEPKGLGWLDPLIPGKSRLM